MCGIAGFCTLDNSPLHPDSPHWLQKMTDLLAHRGPDGQGAWIQHSVALGHRRLSIIDLCSGAQPMSDAQERVTVVFNGEIYNFAEIRSELEAKGCTFRTRSDTEVILHAWLVWGTDCLSRFDGMFAFALWDAHTGTLFCARDRFGKKPFYYSLQNNHFAFASELTALASLPLLDLSVQPQSLMRYLAYEYVPTPQALYSQVSKLPPAHFLLLQDGTLRTERYWDMPNPQPTQASEEDLAAELRRLLTQAVRRRMVSDVPLGVFLSGGIDSSIVAGLMASLGPQIKTFSIGFTEASYDESHYARLVARHYGTDHHERILSADECADILPTVITRLDEPMADASVAPTYLLSGVTREKVTVALGGDGADELLAGYEHYIGFKIAEWYNKLPAFVRKNCIEALARRLPTSAGYINPRLAVATFLQGAQAPAWQRVQTMLTAFTPDMQQHLWAHATSADRIFLQPEQLFAPTREHYAHWKQAAPLERAFHVYARQFLLDDILVKVDRCSMMHSLEVRAPFLDKDVANFVATLPVNMRLKGFKRKYLLKKSCADLLPKEILTRNKRGFQIPVAAWLRGELRPLVEDLLGEQHLREQGLFHPPTVRALVESHMRGQADLRKPLWTLLVLQLWLREHKPRIV